MSSILAFSSHLTTNKCRSDHHFSLKFCYTFFFSVYNKIVGYSVAWWTVSLHGQLLTWSSFYLLYKYLSSNMIKRILCKFTSEQSITWHNGLWQSVMNAPKCLSFSQCIYYQTKSESFAIHHLGHTFHAWFCSPYHFTLEQVDELKCSQPKQCMYTACLFMTHFIMTNLHL